MMTTQDLMKDQASIKKFVSRTIQAKIGNAQLVKANNTQDLSSKTEKGNKTKIKEEVQHIKKILTTDKRVLEIEDFPEIEEKMFYGGYRVPKASLIWKMPDTVSDTESTENDIDIYETYCDVLEILPFRLKLELKTMLDENGITNILYSDSEITSDCWVYWSGSIYLAYTTDNAPPDIDFAHRARDVLRDIYKDSELFSVAVIGPCPIHPDIKIFIFSKEKLRANFTEDDISNMKFGPLKIDKDIIITILLDSEDKVDKSIHQIARAVFWDLSFYLQRFYRAMAIRTLLLRTNEKCSEQFEELTNCLLSIHKLPARFIINKSRKIKELGELTTEMSRLLFKEYEMGITLKDQQGALLRDARDDLIKSLIADYIQEHTTESACIDRQSVSNLLLHADQVLSRQTVFNTQLFSAIIGGIIGGITAVVLIFLSRYLSNLN